MEIFFTELNDTNFATFNWIDQQAIVIKCHQEITSEHLLQCANTLLAVQFEREVSTRSLKALLRTCPNILHLTFTDVLLDEYRRYPEDKVIEHPSVTHVTIRTSTKIGKKEHWLIDFLLWRVSFSNLMSLRIQKIYSRGSSPPVLETNEWMEQFGQLVDSNVLTQLIFKNCATLRELELGGCGLKVRDLVTPTAEQLEQLSQQLGLESFTFSFDADALPAFLQSQRSLKELKSSHIITLHPSDQYFLASINAAISSCILQNYQTLTKVIIYPVVIVDLSRKELLEQDFLDSFTINCAVFQNCPKLQTLRLGLHTYRREEDLAVPESATLMGTKLINLHLLPLRHISELYLPLEAFSHDELELLGTNFSKFVNLQLFYFGTSQLNPSNSYLIRIAWLRVLLQLPKVQKIDFHNGRLEDPEETMLLVQGRPNGREVRLAKNFPRFTFEFVPI